MPVVKTLAKGQVVIPKEIRKALGIKPGTKFHVRVEGKEVSVRVWDETGREFFVAPEKGKSASSGGH